MTIYGHDLPMRYEILLILRRCNQLGDSSSRDRRNRPRCWCHTAPMAHQAQADVYKLGTIFEVAAALDARPAPLLKILLVVQALPLPPKVIFGPAPPHQTPLLPSLLAPLPGRGWWLSVRLRCSHLEQLGRGHPEAWGNGKGRGMREARSHPWRRRRRRRRILRRILRRPRKREVKKVELSRCIAPREMHKCKKYNKTPAGEALLVKKFMYRRGNISPRKNNRTHSSGLDGTSRPCLASLSPGKALSSSTAFPIDTPSPTWQQLQGKSPASLLTCNASIQSSSSRGRRPWLQQWRRSAGSPSSHKDGTNKYGRGTAWGEQMNTSMPVRVLSYRLPRTALT
eukprot:1159210-Pelagomonas_calceolata.AAC.1